MASELLSRLLIAALVSVPSVVIIVLSLLTVVTWSRGVFPVILAVISATWRSVLLVLGDTPASPRLAPADTAVTRDVMPAIDTAAHAPTD